MHEDNTIFKTVEIEPAKLIRCMIPDDGTDISLMQQLKNNFGVTRVESIACRGVNNLQTAKTRPGKLPESALYRSLSIIVDDHQADDVFEFLYEAAGIEEPGRGILIQTTLQGATAYYLPDNIKDEDY